MRKYLSTLFFDSLLLAFIMFCSMMDGIVGQPAQEPSLLRAFSGGAGILLWLWQAWKVWRAREELIAQERAAGAKS